MGITYTRTKSLTAASANCICLSQSVAGAGNLTISGSAATAGIATLDTQRRVRLTFAANETGHNFTLYGINQTGNAIQETIAGTTAGTVDSNLDFKTVTRVAVDAATTGALTVGTNTVGSTPWLAVDLMRQPVNLSFQVLVAGTINYTIEYTQQDVNALAVGNSPTVFAHPTVAAQTTSQSGSFTDPISFVRLTVNSGTGSAVLTYAQAGP